LRWEFLWKAKHRVKWQGGPGREPQLDVTFNVFSGKTVGTQKKSAKQIEQLPF